MTLHLLKNSKGITGVSFKNEKISVKGSELGYKWGVLNDKFTENKVLSKEEDLKTYISEKSEKENNSIAVVDDAIRVKMKEINENANPWETWNKNPNAEKMYNELNSYAETKINVKNQRFTHFEMAELKRKNISDPAEQEQKKGNTMFENLKANREEKTEDKEQNRGFKR